MAKSNRIHSSIATLSKPCFTTGTREKKDEKNWDEIKSPVVNIV